MLMSPYSQTEEEYSEMMESEEIKATRESHQEFRELIENKLLNTLNEIKQSRNVRLHNFLYKCLYF